MEYRRLGASGFRVPALSLGTATFGGTTEFFKGWGSTDVRQATRMVDICLEHGANLFDSADVYSQGAAEQILGGAIKGRRNQVLISTKATFPSGEGPNEYGSSRFHLIETVEKALVRLGTEHIDLFQLHGYDAWTPVEETLSTLDTLVRAGKIRYVGCSNFSGWHLMKSLMTADRYGYPRHIAHQAYYSLIGRDYEWELMPLGIEQGVGAIVWSPLGWGKLTGKIRRDRPPQAGSRAKDIAGTGPEVADERLFKVVDVLDQIAQEAEKSITQVALNWLLQRPTVSSVIIGARNEEQLVQNLGAVGWQLSPEQMARLNAVSALTPSYPTWHQGSFPVLQRPI
jgi:aryl-alcohol dehydrogenase-like predicted oxidoreductase